jgi:predicted metal-binding protein
MESTLINHVRPAGETVTPKRTAVRPLGGPISDQALRADLERYRELALALGATDAVIIPAGDVPIDERVRLKCLVPRCRRAGETPNCPPHAPDLDLIRRALSRFSWAILFKCHVEPIEAYAPANETANGNQKRTLSFHQKSGKIIYELERQAYKDGYGLAMGFGGGSCKDYLCKGLECQFLDSGRCRFPHRSRPAMEAMGINVVELARKVGWESYALLDDLRRIPCAITVGIVFIH